MHSSPESSTRAKLIGKASSFPTISGGRKNGSDIRGPIVVEHDVIEASEVPQNELERLTPNVKSSFVAQQSYDDLDEVTSDDTLDTNEQAELDLLDALEESEKDNELPREKRMAMTDERLAHRLGKQEAIGLGSEALLLFRGDENEEVVQDEGVDMALLRQRALNLNQPGMRTKSSTSVFASSGLFSSIDDEDAYCGFDVMDRDRPSISGKAYKHKGKLTFDLSDSELENAMIVTWKNDRVKKKQRKQQREELRAQGHLGQGEKTDMKAKYFDGINMSQVKVELRQFLASSNETCVIRFRRKPSLLTLNSMAFPPMDKSCRKIIHEIANTFGIKSNSRGNGNNRFPCLFKSSRTKAFQDSKWKAIETRMAQRFLPRTNSTRARRSKPTQWRGNAMAGATYQEGEVVGRAAPELGSDNKGRAMLEKMGWSSGTALGSINNKGMLVPIPHIMKNNKAGLG